MSSKFSDEFDVKSLLGEGGFGSVFEAENRFDGWSYAVKRIAVDKSETTRALREIRAMVQLDHPGIVRYNHSWSEEPTEESQREADSQILEKIGQPSKHLMKFTNDSVIIYIQMQLCKSSLEEWLESNKTLESRSLSRMKMWFKQLLSAVAYIHEQNLIHRDLKPSNIMFAGENKLKVCDLGISTIRRVAEDSDNTRANRTKNVGTPMYKSPELQFNAEYSSKTDVFSLGAMFAEMCVVMTSSERSKTFDMYRLGRKTNFVAERCPEAAEIVLWLTQKQFKRPSCSEVLAHEFLAQTKCVYCSV